MLRFGSAEKRTALLLLTDTKISLRHHYRHLRRQISFEQQAMTSQSIAELFFKKFLLYKKNVAVYLAQEGEVNLQCLIEKLWKTKNSVFLPVVDFDTQSLSFAKYFESSMMKKNHYGIDEPENISTTIFPEALDVVLMPLVAFDDNGVRLGLGKGYYDKSFSFCRYPHDKPVLVGVAHQCQHCETLPTDEWDVPLDGVMTEKKLILFNENL